MAQQRAPNTNRWSTTSTAIPTRPASYTDIEKDSAPLAELPAVAPPPPNTANNTAPHHPHPPPTPATTLDWTSPSDPLNPHNWPALRRWFQTLTISSIALVGTFASSVFTPAIPPTTSSFSSPPLLATFAFSIYQLGLAFGGPFAAPLSETYGRKPVVFLSLPVFGLFVLGTGFAQSMPAIVVTRFWAGVFAAPSLSMGSGTLSDLWTPERRSGPMAVYVAAPFFGPAIGPLLGAAVTTHLSWRWTSWLILFATVLFVLLPAPFYCESYKPVLLRQRARKAHLPVPPSPLEGMSWSKALRVYASKTLTRPLHMLVTEPIVLAFNAYTFFAAFPRVYAEFYNFNSLSTGLTFLSIGAGVVAASITILLFSKKWYGWTTAYRVHYIVPTIAEGLFGYGNMLVFMSCMMYMTDTYGPLYSASAMASNAVLRYILGGTFPLFAVQMFESGRRSAVSIGEIRREFEGEKSV
ncbi:hypothetical protein E8E13_001547 [Curvularia kusanoi]|uniref:Major facilitator superfamily (MFS) profile domain-containing protein n=1 Tax=Curvularia kusanoi TaxID=90978 RepID=A0A9P4T4R5_CURKU|nr:hypothetical protein E8E13_001547 [Curvularia kusanoi]